MLQRVEGTKHLAYPEIPRVRGADIGPALALHREQRRPLILEGAGAAWRAVKLWSPAYLAEIAGDVQVRPSVGLPDTEVPYTLRDKDYRRAMTVREFVALMQSGDRCYIDQIPVDRLPGLADDYDFTPLTSDIKAVIIWIGANTRSGLHYDHADNLFAQVHGTKRVLMAAPEQAYNLHLFPDSHTKSQVAPEHPDLAAHPRFARAAMLQGFLEPGDILFLPRAWWHYFASSESSISLSCWHGEPLTPRHDVEVMMRMRSPTAWALLARDFIWHGLLARPRPDRLYSPPSTGQMLYHLVSTSLSRPKGH
ncbi:cupin-like domain-containing protein [Bradyrhizobium sp. HKCCYLS2038]|uniref:cupin-like domain-containing protein n=1 Tax=unclassified Bradyrhizobium TaxID=2631580 RepID=UPI003EC0A7B1